MVGHDELQKLADIIVAKINEEFEIKHLSRNLVNTIKIEMVEDKIDIIIPAETYDILKFKEKGVVIPTGKGSYASKLDEEGSSLMVSNKNGSYQIKPGNHKGFLDKVIK